MSDAMSTNVDAGPMSPHGDTVNCAGMDMLIVRARCCRDWPVLALTHMGRCGYCGQVPVVVAIPFRFAVPVEELRAALTAAPSETETGR